MDQATKDDTGRAAPVTAGQVVEICGPLDDDRVMAIIGTGATIEQIEEAAAWADGESDVMAELRIKASGPAAAVYDILRAEQRYAEDRD